MIGLFKCRIKDFAVILRKTGVLNELPVIRFEEIVIFIISFVIVVIIIVTIIFLVAIIVSTLNPCILTK